MKMKRTWRLPVLAALCVSTYAGDWMLHCHLPHHMMNQMVSMVGPMAQRHGLDTGGGMEEGMGVVRQGHALSADLGPKFGRGLGLAERERAVTPLVAPAGSGNGHAAHGSGPNGRKRVPGFPQDMSMPMDDAVAKPETYGLAPGWSGATQGMMTLVRVLPPDRYAEVMRRVREGRVERPSGAPATSPGGEIPAKPPAGGHGH